MYSESDMACQWLAGKINSAVLCFAKLRPKIYLITEDILNVLDSRKSFREMSFNTKKRVVRKTVLANCVHYSIKTLNIVWNLK